MPADDGPRLIPALERATFRAEAPVRKAVRSNRLNPLPYAGTISVFLLIVVIATGVYITLFFSFGFEASHRSVERMHDHPIQSTIRTIHRYASGWSSRPSSTPGGSSSPAASADRVAGGGPPASRCSSSSGWPVSPATG
jgi:hypothetical protein